VHFVQGALSFETLSGKTQQFVHQMAQ